MGMKWKMAAAALLLIIIAVPAVLAVTTCADGCICMAPEDAKNKGYSYCLAKETPCGTDNLGREMFCFSTGQATPSVTSGIQPQATVTTSCGQGCGCMAESDAKAKFGGSYQRCSDMVCGYDKSSSTAAPLYCFKNLEQGTTVQATPSAVCPAGCACLNEAEAKTKFNGAYGRCSDTPCGYDKTTTSVSARYCFREIASSTTAGGAAPAVSQVCPDGCGCISDEEGQKMGYSYCNGIQKLCGYQSWTGSTASTSGQQPLYCYSKGATSTSCGEGCECMSEAAAVQNLGTYQFCSNTICGYEKSTTTGTISTASNAPVATGIIPKYCLRKAGVPVQSTGCSYNKEKNACTGTCTDNTGCVVVGTEKNTVTGEETPICKCQPGSCYFDYALDSCAGSCSSTGQKCQVNTMSKDPLTGKTLYADCHCKGVEPAAAATPQVITPVNTASVTQSETVAKPCSCDPVANTCTGTCDGNAVCTQTKTVTDAAGKVSCADCQCTNACSYDLATKTCTGACPGGVACTAVTVQDLAAGVEKTECSCGNVVAGTTIVPVPTPVSTSAAANPFQAIGNIFKSFFGWK